MNSLLFLELITCMCPVFTKNKKVYYVDIKFEEFFYVREYEILRRKDPNEKFGMYKNFKNLNNHVEIMSFPFFFQDKEDKEYEYKIFILGNEEFRTRPFKYNPEKDMFAFTLPDSAENNNL